MHYIYFGRHFGLPDKTWGEPVSDRVKEVRRKFAKLRAYWVRKFQEANCNA